jgi:hypothetical protein
MLLCILAVPPNISHVAQAVIYFHAWNPTSKHQGYIAWRTDTVYTGIYNSQGRTVFVVLLRRLKNQEENHRWWYHYWGYVHSQGCSSTIAIAWISSCLDWWIIDRHRTKIADTRWSFPLCTIRLEGPVWRFLAHIRLLSFLRLLCQFSYPPGKLSAHLSVRTCAMILSAHKGQRGWL